MQFYTYYKLSPSKRSGIILKSTVCSIFDKGYRFGFNGKELDNETDLQDYGMRIYNPTLGKFLSVDPISRHYPHYSPYQFAGNKPIWAVDLDGLEEAIIVSGHPGEMKGKDHFLVNGLNNAKKQKSNSNVKNVTWIVYQNDSESDKQDKTTYTDAQLKTYKEKAKKAGINLIVVHSAEEIVDYVNTGSTTGTGERTKASGTLVEHFGYVGHADPHGLLVGYQESGFDDDVETDEFNSDAFSSTSTGDLTYACRTAVAGWFTDSQAKDLSERVGKEAKGTTTRTWFNGGIRTALQLLSDYYTKRGKANGEEKGTVKTYKGTGGTGS